MGTSFIDGGYIVGFIIAIVLFIVLYWVTKDAKIVIFAGGAVTIIFNVLLGFWPTWTILFMVIFIAIFIVNPFKSNDG